MFQCNPFFPCTIITWQNIAWMLCSHQQLPSLLHHDVASFALVIIELHEPSPHPSPGTHSVGYFEANCGWFWWKLNSNGCFPGTKKTQGLDPYIKLRLDPFTAPWVPFHLLFFLHQIHERGISPVLLREPIGSRCWCCWRLRLIQSRCSWSFLVNLLNINCRIPIISLKYFLPPEKKTWHDLVHQKMHQAASNSTSSFCCSISFRFRLALTVVLIHDESIELLWGEGETSIPRHMYTEWLWILW